VQIQHRHRSLNRRFFFAENVSDSRRIPSPRLRTASEYIVMTVEYTFGPGSLFLKHQ